MKLLKIFMSICLVLFCTFTFMHGRNLINSESNVVKSEEFQGVISLWQIDGFEGGVGSRKQFLLKIARQFEKENSGVLIMVTNMSKKGAEENIQNGILPDMISFSNGIDLRGMTELNTDRKSVGGVVGNVSYAVAWCRGGYVLIENPKYVNKDKKYEFVLVSQGEYTQPILAMCLEELKFNDIEILSPMNAYVKFVSGKSRYLLGTQRDVNRLKAREMTVNCTPFVEYNDLYQYVLVSSKDPLKQFYSGKFIDFLLSEKCQKELYNIGMMSCFFDVKFENDHLNQMQMIKNNYTLSAFTHSAYLKELQNLSQSWVSGSDNVENKIKKMLIKS